MSRYGGYGPIVRFGSITTELGIDNCQNASNFRHKCFYLVWHEPPQFRLSLQVHRSNHVLFFATAVVAVNSQQASHVGSRTASLNGARSRFVNFVISSGVPHISERLDSPQRLLIMCSGCTISQMHSKSTLLLANKLCHQCVHDSSIQSAS